MDKTIDYTFNKEQLQQLYPAEVHFTNAVKSNILRNCQRSMVEKVRVVYESATGEKVRQNWSCSACTLKFMKKVGQIYFRDKLWWELFGEEEQETKHTDEEPTPQVQEQHQEEKEETETTGPETIDTNKRRRRYGWRK